MAIAVVNFNELKAYAELKGFPFHTKVSLEPNGNGHKLFNDWIHANVEWVTELGFDPVNQVKLTETAQLTGDLPSPHELRTQKFIEGTEEFNSLKPLIVDGKTYDVLVNGKAIQNTIQEAELRYVLEFESDIVSSVNLLKVAIFDTAEDTSLTYHSDVPVKYLYLTTVKDIEGVKTLFKTPYSSELAKSEYAKTEYEVGPLSEEEYELWVQHNIKSVTAVEDIAVPDFNALKANF